MMYSFLPRTQYGGEDFVEHLTLMQKYRTFELIFLFSNV